MSLNRQPLRKGNNEWIKEIKLALNNNKLKALNAILKKIPADQLAEVLNSKTHIFSTKLIDLIHALDYKTIHQGIENLPNRLHQNHFVEFFSALLKDLDNRVVFQYKPGDDFPHCFLPPYLHECACGANAHRLHSNRRNKIENRILQTAQTRFTDHTKTINYLSFGSGYLLQDFVLILNLILLGYSLNVILIEWRNQTTEFQNALWQLQFLVYPAAEKGLSFKITCFTTLKDYLQYFPSQEIHIAHALDFPNLPINEIQRIHYRLHQKGFLYFTDRYHTILIDRNNFYISQRIDDLGNYERVKPLYKAATLIPTNSRHAALKAEVIENSILKKKGVNQEIIVNNVLSYLGLFKSPNTQQNISETVELKLANRV